MAIRAYYKQIEPSDLEEILKEELELYKDWNWDISTLPDLDLDKQWDTLHLLLTGKWNKNRSILSKAIFGGSILGDVEEDGFDEATENYFGSTTYLTVSEVKEVALALSDISEEELRNRFDKNNLSDDYGDPEELLLPYFRQMLAFYSDAAKQEKAVVVDIG